jgi:predicted S18 family serine protease
VLPVGGIKEKVLAAHRVGLKTVILPAHNEADLDEVPPELRAELNFVLANTAEQVLEHALELSAKKSDTPAESAARGGGARARTPAAAEKMGAEGETAADVNGARRRASRPSQ